jgi:tetratricopeptide (TPR) repeat protein
MPKNESNSKDSRTNEISNPITDQIKHLQTSAIHAEASLDWSKALEFYNKIVALQNTLPEIPDNTVFEIQNKRAKCFHNLGDVEAEISTLEDILTLAQEKRDISQQVNIVNDLEFCYVQHGDLEKAFRPRKIQ